MQVRLGPAKGKDFASSLGPWICHRRRARRRTATPDGFLDLRCTASVNGAEVGRDLLSNMGWTFEPWSPTPRGTASCVPGDVLGSGTVGNGGCLAELWGRYGDAAPPPAAPTETWSTSASKASAP